MKTLLLRALFTALFVGGSWVSGHSMHQNDPTPTPGWIAAPNASFAVRTLQAANGLLIYINNTGQRDLTLTIWTADGIELTTRTLDRRPGHVVSFDLHQFTGSAYRIEVANDTERVVKNLTVKVRDNASWQAEVSVVGTGTRL